VSQATLREAAWIERRGLPHRAADRRADVFGERPVDLLAEDAAPRAEDLFALATELAGLARLAGIDDDRVARAKGRAFVRLLDHAGAVEAEDDRQPVRDPGAAVAHVEIDAVEAACDHADERFAGLSLRRRDLVQPQRFVAAMAVFRRAILTP